MSLDKIDKNFIDRLIKKSMLAEARELLRSEFKDYFIAGSSSNPRIDVIDKISTWISIYPNAIVTKPGRSPFVTLKELLEFSFDNENKPFPQCIGIKGIYLSPLNRSGGVALEDPARPHTEKEEKDELSYYHSTDGNFDPISMKEFDPDIGTKQEYTAFIDLAHRHNTRRPPSGPAPSRH